MAERKKPEIMSAWDFMARFPTDKGARMRWGDEPRCPHLSYGLVWLFLRA